MQITVIITAAGVSRRMRGVNKLLLNLLGKPVIARTIEVFQKNKNINEIIITGNKDSRKQYEKIVKKYKFDKVKKIINGGDTRFASVYNALKEAGTDYVLIHDGARCLVTGEIIDAVIISLSKNSAVICAVPAKDTVKLCRGTLQCAPTIEKTIDRKKIYMAQTPQGFKTGLILKAYEKIITCKGATCGAPTDDAAAVEVFNKPVKVVPGSYENIKITTPVDLIIAEAMLLSRKRDNSRD